VKKIFKEELLKRYHLTKKADVKYTNDVDALTDQSLIQLICHRNNCQRKRELIGVKNIIKKQIRNSSLRIKCIL
jgi:hypothetical protein